MKLKNKLVGIIVILGTVMFVGGINPLAGLSNHKNSYISENSANASTKNSKYLMLVNKKKTLNLDYEPENLVKPNVKFLSSTSEESRQMDETAAKALEELFQGAKEENITLLGSSAYRSYKSQVRVLNDEISSKGVNYANKYVAKPGKSEHQSGLSIDVTNEARCFDKTSPEAQWLANNAHRFGFILRYLEGKEDITGYNYEPWHIRYVGKDAAKEIHERNITLEEYLNHMV
ncbi:M15 family metallopeptidase [Terrisporobacter petrolearius]|uniref:M15 family metallopeptidase n=1 Tax=Terrisporobacter petrolearius TaxID=1460447 RepID=UPI001D16F1E3|nr:M15 family metallopeptidase [Terrisporobacter petrolearius]MCC3866170.1 M15 family metallopeptidase [Terrisporobacter petrolearius]